MWGEVYGMRDKRLCARIMPMVEVNETWSKVVSHLSTSGCKSGKTSGIPARHMPAPQDGCMRQLWAGFGMRSVRSCPPALISARVIDPEPLCPNQKQWFSVPETREGPAMIGGAPTMCGARHAARNGQQSRSIASGDLRRCSLSPPPAQPQHPPPPHTHTTDTSAVRMLHSPQGGQSTGTDSWKVVVCPRRGK